MKKKQESWLSAVKAENPNWNFASVFDFVRTDLDIDEPNRKSNRTLAFSPEGVGIFEEAKLIKNLPMEEVTSFEIEAGLGCYFLSYLPKGETANPVLLARGSAGFYPMAAQAVKHANHYLRYRDVNFSKFTDLVGSFCPRCGKPFPRGTKTCPRCASKKKAILRLFSMGKSEWKPITLSIVLFFLTTALSLLTPYIQRRMVDDYIQNENGSALIAGFIGILAALIAARVGIRLVGILRGYFLTVGGNNLIRKLRDQTFRKIQTLSIAGITRRTSGELMKNVGQDNARIKNFLINQLPSCIEQGLLLLAITAVLFLYDWKLALLILLPAPFIVFALMSFRRKMRRLYVKRWEINTRQNSTLHDTFSGIRVVKSYGMEKREEERFVSQAEAEMKAQIMQEKTWSYLMPLLSFVMGLGEYVILYYVGSKMLAGTMTAGEMSQFSSYAGMIYGPLNTLMTIPRQFMMMMTSLTRVTELLDEPPDVQDTGNEKWETPVGRIEIDHVAFGYDDADEVLRDVNLTVEPGEFVGLVGKSGVGKSTLINLIMRMYDCDEGQIRIDGIDIRNIPQSELRSKMGVVLQENFLFSGTVYQNIAYSKPHASREEIVRAAKLSGAHSFIVNLPDGYNTYVGEKGYTLSGGERQRISIARALLHDPKILILDEATASLDTETEKLIQDALKSLSKGRTTIAIAHRLSTLRNANKLVVMDRGGIAEVGTHDELMEKQGIYYGLVMAQREMSKMEDPVSENK